MRSRRRSAPASGPPRSAAHASSSASGPSAKVRAKHPLTSSRRGDYMSVSEAAKRPEHRGRTLRLLLAFLLVIAAASASPGPATNPLRGETTESGVRIRTVEKGEGPFVQSVDGVLVEYEGRLADGTVFDDSDRHGGPQPMIAGQVIPGFAEALTKMQKGGKLQDPHPGQACLWREPASGQSVRPQRRPRFRRAHRPDRSERGADVRRGEVRRCRAPSRRLSLGPRPSFLGAGRRFVADDLGSLRQHPPHDRG